jgi:hypothetical protein
VADIGITGAGIVAAGWAGRKLLGPLFDEIADDWRQRYSYRRQTNLNRIGRRAQAKLGESINEPGEVAPRLAVAVMESGSWCDAEVMSEYFGGILAASRSPDGSDDRGVAWANLVSTLPTYDVYVHYLIYEAFRRTFLGQGLDLGNGIILDSSTIYLPIRSVLTATGLELSAGSWGAVSPSVTSLARHGLIADHYAFGSIAELTALNEAYSREIPEEGVIVSPSISGIELYLWAHGYRVDASRLLDANLSMEAVGDLGRVEDVQEVAKMPFRTPPSPR